MADRGLFEFNTALSEEEKCDLETLIEDYQQSRESDCDASEGIQKQIDDLEKRIAALQPCFSPSIGE